MIKFLYMEFTDTIIQISIILCIGSLAGFFGSLLGIGGAMIVTPAITIVYGLDIKYAIGAGIIVVIATSSGAAISYLKDNVINLRAAMFLEIFTSAGGIVGALITGMVAPWILYIMFAMLLMYSVINMIIRYKKEGSNIVKETKPNKIATKLKLNSQYYDQKLKQNISYNVTNVPIGSAIMFGAGIASGMLGIGSGIFKVIAMDTAMKMPLKPSSATSNLMMGVTACASSIVFFLNGQIVPQIAVPVALGVLIGAAIGSRVMPKLHPKVIRIIFIPTMLFFCIQMIMKAVAGL